MKRLLAVLFTLVWSTAPSFATEIVASTLRRRATQGANEAIRLIDRTSATFLTKRKCFTCHTQTFAVLVLTNAERTGIEINEENLAAQVARSYEIYESLGGVRPDTVGHALLTLDMGKQPPNDRTEAMLRYLLEYGKESGHWQVAIENREPAEASNFTTNFLAVRAANRYGTDDLKESIATRRKAVEEWFAKAEAKDTEDQVFRLFLANELGMSPKTRDPFALRLLDEQLAGGGWAQQPGMAPDAYATASALVALNKAGGISTENDKWRSGIEYLLQTQQPDGSWHVASRAKPVQEYFESGFPHGEDQFISAFATGWATEALLILLQTEALHDR